MDHHVSQTAHLGPCLCGHHGTEREGFPPLFGGKGNLMFLEDEQPTTQTLEMCWSWVRTEDNKGVTLGYPFH